MSVGVVAPGVSLLGVKPTIALAAACAPFALARVWRLPQAGAALTGVVVALGNFLSAQTHHRNIVRTASWLPLVLALVESALRQATWGPRPRLLVLAALALGM